MQSIFSLNATAEAVWALLEEPRSIDELVSEVSKSFSEKEPGSIKTDIETLLNDFLETGVIEPVGG